MEASSKRMGRSGAGASKAGQHKEQASALVRVAVELDDQETEDLRAALGRVFQQPLELEIETRPEILGGVWVRVGDTVIDGSLTGELETLRHHLRTQCASMLTASIWSNPKDTGA